MKIDYELVNKIGATHYCDKTYRLYKVSAMTLLVYIDDNWKLCLAGVAALNHIKPIPPKRTRTEYDKVTESIFDLRDEFERGELYADDKGIVKIQGLAHLGGCCQVGVIYRKVEKEIDERKEFVVLAISKIDHTNSDDPGYYADWFEQLYDSGCRFQD